MTIDDVADIGQLCLVEHEGRLKVKAIRPFDRSATPIAQHLEVNLNGLRPEIIKAVIDSVLERLGAMGDCDMSEPEFTELVGSELRNVAYKDLRLTFTSAFDANLYKSHLWIACHCYPMVPGATLSVMAKKRSADRLPVTEDGGERDDG